MKRKQVRYLVESLMIKVALNEGRKHREQLYKKYPGLIEFYKHYETMKRKGKVSVDIDHNEMRWLAKNWPLISREYRHAANDTMNTGTPPLGPFIIEDMVGEIEKFIKSKEKLSRLYDVSKNKYDKETLDLNNIKGADIAKYFSFRDIRAAMSYVATKEEITGGKELPSNVIIGTFNGYEMSVPQNKKESVSFDSDPEFKTTTWCTTRSAGQNLFDNYTKNGGILFYFKKKSVTDEKAAEKNDDNRYKDPYTRFCIGIGKGKTKPEFPKEGEGAGRLIVDQNNAGVSEERAKKILGQDFDKVIKAIEDYNKQINNQLPFAKSFDKIVKSVSAVAEVIKDYTFPEKYDFLCNPDNRDSIIRLSQRQNYISLPVKAYAEKFKLKIDKEIKKIMKQTDSKKIATYCFYGIKKYKKDSLCKQIVDEKLNSKTVSPETVDEFFNLVLSSPSLSYFESSGYDERLIQKFVSRKLAIELPVYNQSNSLAQTQQKITAYFESYSAALDNISDILSNPDGCLLAKKEIKESIDTRFNPINPSITNRTISATIENDLHLKPGFGPDTLLAIDSIYKSTKQSYLTLSQKISNPTFDVNDTINELSSRTSRGLLKLFIDGVGPQISALSKSLSQENYLRLTDLIFDQDEKTMHESILKLFFKQSVPDVNQLEVYSLLNDTQKNKLSKELIVKYFGDTADDAAEGRDQLFPMIMQKHPIKYLKALGKFLKSTSIIQKIIDRLFSEINTGENTAMQDFLVNQGVSLDGYSGMISAYVIPYLRRAQRNNKIDNEKANSFLNRLASFDDSDNKTSKNSYKILQKISQDISEIQDINVLYSILKKLIRNTSDEAMGNSYDDNPPKREVIKNFMRGFDKTNFSRNQILAIAIQDGLTLHASDGAFKGGEYLGLVLGNPNGDTTTDWLTGFCTYMINKIEDIEKPTSVYFNAKGTMGFPTLSDIKEVFSALGNNGILFDILPAGYSNIESSEKSIREFIDMHNNITNRTSHPRFNDPMAVSVASHFIDSKANTKEEITEELNKILKIDTTFGTQLINDYISMSQGAPEMDFLKALIDGKNKEDNKTSVQLN